MRLRLIPSAVSVLTLGFIYLSYRAAVYNSEELSPQACRMARMWPDYVLQKDFNTSWTPLARRYSLWVYREGYHSDTSRQVTASLCG